MESGAQMLINKVSGLMGQLTLPRMHREETATLTQHGLFVKK